MPSQTGLHGQMSMALFRIEAGHGRAYRAHSQSLPRIILAMYFLIMYFKKYIKKYINKYIKQYIKKASKHTLKNTLKIQRNALCSTSSAQEDPEGFGGPVEDFPEQLQEGPPTLVSQQSCAE